MTNNKGVATILDCTLRDGGYAINFQFTTRDTKAICIGLEQAGIQMIELGHGLGLGASSTAYGVAFESDDSHIEAAASVIKNAQIGAFYIPGIGTKENIHTASESGLNFVRIGCEVENFETAIEHAEFAKKQGLYVSINLMKTYSVQPNELISLSEKINRLGTVDCVAVVDSSGCLLPHEVGEYVSALTDTLDAAVGFHGHNNLEMANANCLSALDAGALIVDSTLRGMGRSSGNAQTEILAHALPGAGYAANVDAYALLTVIEEHIDPLMWRPQGQDPLDVVIGMSRFHSSHLPKIKRVLDRYDVDMYRLIAEVSKIDCVNPSDDLITSIARDLSRTENSQ
jgi:4-hydroxy 2-oxovalerate aldolase